MIRIVLSIAAVLAAAGIVPAQDKEKKAHGGKVDWVRNPAYGLAKAKLEGRAAVLFFTADWSGYCKELSTGVFSDSKVVEATEAVVPILVDLSDVDEETNKANQALAEHFGVHGIPTVSYVDPNGQLVREEEINEPAGILSNIKSHARKFGGRPSMWVNSMKTALEAGRKVKKPVCIFLAAEEENPDVFGLLQKITKDVGDRKTKAVWYFDVGSPTTIEKYGGESAPSVVIVDPTSVEPFKEPLAKVAYTPGTKPEALLKAIDEAAKKVK